MGAGKGSELGEQKAASVAASPGPVAVDASDASGMSGATDDASGTPVTSSASVSVKASASVKASDSVKASAKPRFTISPAVARAMLLCSAALWGGSYTCCKIALDVLTPQWLVCVRMLAASACMLLLFHRQIVPFLKPKIIVPALVVGVSYWGLMCTQAIGLQTIDPGRSSFLTAVYCVLTPFAAWAISKAKPRAINLVAALVCLAGVGFISLNDGGELKLSSGDWLTLLAAVLTAINITFLGKYTRIHGPIAMTWVQFLIAGVLFLTGALITEPAPSAAWLQPHILGCLVYLALGASMTAQVFQNISLVNIPTSQASIIMCSESLFALLFGVLFYGEQVGWNSFAGFALILVAMWLSIVRK